MPIASSHAGAWCLYIDLVRRVELVVGWQQHAEALRDCVCGLSIPGLHRSRASPVVQQDGEPHLLSNLRWVLGMSRAACVLNCLSICIFCHKAEAIGIA